MFSFEESYGNLSKHTQEAALFANTYYMLYTYKLVYLLLQTDMEKKYR